LFLLPPKILCIASLRKLFLAAAGAKQDGQKSGFILFAFLKEVYADQILLKRYKSAFKEMAPRKAPTFDEKNTVCGPGYTLKCPGTRECYYGNNLGTYLDTCERKNINLTWLLLKADTLGGATAGVAGGAFFFRVGAGPGAVAGGLLGFLVGGAASTYVLLASDSRCRNTLADLCATCRARCVEP
jgi:hypothetical protein